MKKLFIFSSLALPLLLHGQETEYDQCMTDVASALNGCLDKAEKARVAAYATADGHYNDCIDPASPSSTGLGGCYRQALQKCGADDTCLTTERANCDGIFLGPAGVCKTIQTGEYAAADTNKQTANDACYATFSQDETGCLTYLYGDSPIVIDVTGEGFRLTNKQHGVKFKLTPPALFGRCPGPIPSITTLGSFGPTPMEVLPALQPTCSGT